MFKAAHGFVEVDDLLVDIVGRAGEHEASLHRLFYGRFSKETDPLARLRIEAMIASQPDASSLEERLRVGLGRQIAWRVLEGLPNDGIAAQVLHDLFSA